MSASLIVGDIESILPLGGSVLLIYLASVCCTVAEAMFTSSYGHGGTSKLFRQGSNMSYDEVSSASVSNHSVAKSQTRAVAGRSTAWLCSKQLNVLGEFRTCTTINIV